MKNLLLIFSFCLAGSMVFSQDDYRVGVNFGSGFNYKGTEFFKNGENKFTSRSIGLEFQKRYYNWGYFTYALRYSKIDISIGEYMSDGQVVPGIPFQQNVISLGIAAKPFFYKEYVFASIGMLFDYSSKTIKNRNYESHNGFGVTAGLGTDISLGNLVLSIHPQLRGKSVVDFYDRCGDCGDDFGPPLQFELFAEVGLAYKIF